MRYRVLGPLEVAVDGAVRAIGSPNQRLVLAALVARPGSVVTTDALIDALWEEDPPPSALSTLRTYVSRLRRVVGTDLAAEQRGYRLVVDPSEVDATHFERCLHRAMSAPPAEAVTWLDQALKMWRGPAFGDLADRPLIRTAARRLEELRAGAHEDRVAGLLASGDVRHAVADASALVLDHPEREGVWITLVDALIAAGRTADATRAATRARAALADAGLEPSPGLRRAEARALGIETEVGLNAGTVPGSGPESEVGRRAVPPATGTLQPTRRPSTFVGRQRELDDLVTLLARAQVVTLVGPGGVGKTRLALEAMAAAAPQHRLGWQMIDLGTLSADEDVIGTVAAGLGLVAGRSIDEALLRGGDLDMLVLLDNADHVAPGAARAVELLTGGGGSMRIVVTSRERLGVDGEHVRVVRPLPSDGRSSPAQRLFHDRADAAGTILDPELDEQSITRLVQRLDGLPLAIEMAAAQLTSSSLAELLAMLDGRADELRAPVARGPSRHRSLAELIDWSVDRLDPDDVEMLHRLTVFAGSVSVEDVTGVLGHDGAGTARRLVDRSLVSAVVSGERTRLRVLHVVRDRMTRRLGPVPHTLHSAHARWFLGRARAATALLASTEERSGRDALTAILDELRAAHRWAIEHDRPLALALSATVHLYAQCSLNDEVLSWAERLIGDGMRPGDDVDHVAVAMASAASRMVNRGEHERGASFARRAVSLTTGPEQRVPALEMIGDAMLFDGRLLEAEDAYRALLDDARAVGDRWYEAVGLSGVLLVAAYSGQPAPDDVPEDDAEAPPSSRAWLAYSWAELLAADDPRRAETLLRRALDLARSVPNPYIEGVTLVSLASLQGQAADPTAALATFRQAIEHWLAAADRTHQVTTLRNLAVLFGRLDLPAEAAELLGGLDASDVATYGDELARLDAVGRWLEATMDADRLAAARQHGGRRDVTDLAQWALTVIDRVHGPTRGRTRPDEAGTRSSPADEPWH